MQQHLEGSESQITSGLLILNTQSIENIFGGLSNYSECATHSGPCSDLTSCGTYAGECNSKCGIKGSEHTLA